MTTKSATIAMMDRISDGEKDDATWRGIYIIGGAAALGQVLTAVSEIAITFLPGGNASSESVIDWFNLFQDNWFLGLRNLGLLNIIFTALGIPILLALYGALRRADKAYAALAAIIGFIGTAVFYATNRAFPMLALSREYAAASTEAQRALLAAAGQALLAVGESHTPGTFMGFFLTGSASIMMAFIMLRSQVFSKATAYAGFLGLGCLLVFDICASFAPVLFDTVMIVAMIGGISSMVWYILIARRLFQLGRKSA